MHLRKALLAAIAVTVIAFSAGLRGQDFVDGVKVTLPQPVTVGEKVLQPGDYEIRRASQFQDQVLRIYNNDKMVYETNVITVPTEGKQTPEDSKVILQHVGDNYYFDKIWIQGKDFGYEFALPDRVKALKRELAVTVPAKYESSTASTAATASSQSTTQAGDTKQSDQPAADTKTAEKYEGPGLANELDALAAQQEREQSARNSSPADLNNHEQQQQADVTRQDRNDRPDQVAALQNEPAPVTPSQSDARPAQSQSQTQSGVSSQSSTQSQSSVSSQSSTETRQSSVSNNANAPEQLPSTATNWLAFVIGGVLLLTLSFAVRPRTQE
jgi:hypothetical protein